MGGLKPMTNTKRIEQLEKDIKKLKTDLVDIAKIILKLVNKK